MKSTAVILAILVLIAPCRGYAARDLVIHFERPDIVEGGGAVVRTLREKAGTIKGLQGKTLDHLDYLEAVNRASISRELLAALGPGSAECRTILENAIPGASGVFREGYNDMMAVLDGAPSPYGQSSQLNVEEAEEFLREAIIQMVEETDTTDFINEWARREFWEKIGVYEKYTVGQIAYLNKIVIPAVAVSLVTDRTRGYYDFWQALNGVGAEVSTTSEGRDVIYGVSRTEDFQFSGAEEVDFQRLMEVYDGSNGSLGLIYHAARELGSSAGYYASTEGPLGDYDEVLNIPASQTEPMSDLKPPEPADPGPLPPDGFNFTIKAKITK